MSKETTCSLTGLEWAQLLCSQPQFADRCDWSTLDGNAWHCLLCKRPQFADRCDWSFAKKWRDSESGRWYWVTLLVMQPQFADKCDIWADLKDSVGHWRRVARSCTNLFNRCGGKKRRSMSSDQYDSEKPDGTIQALILKMDPSGALLPGFAHFSGKNWGDFLLSSPSIPESVLGQCEWSKLDGGNWAELLCKQPQFSDKCDWSKLDGMNWADLLSKQPQFADRCDWSKFDGNDSFWQELLFSRPEFKDEFESRTGRKYEELNMDDFIPRGLW